MIHVAGTDHVLILPMMIKSAWYPNELVMIKQIPCSPTRKKNVILTLQEWISLLNISHFKHYYFFCLCTLGHLLTSTAVLKNTLSFEGFSAGSLSPQLEKKLFIQGILNDWYSWKSPRFASDQKSQICLTSSKMKCISTYFTLGMKLLVSLGVAEITRSEKRKALR